jgi:PAS domain S-box-containing protein
MALLIAVSGLFAMMFEVRYFSQYSFEVYLTRLLATIISFAVLVIANYTIAKRFPVFLVHVLLISIIASSAYMTYLIPSTLVTNSQIVGLMIFTSALFLSWEVKNQIIVAIYYNIVFSFAILVNDRNIYFLPNMYESVIFVLFLSILSVIGSAVNFRIRLHATKNAIQVQNSERRFRAIFNNSAEGIFQSTLDGKFIIVNPAMVKILGYADQAELLSVNIANDVFKSADEREKLIELINEKGSVIDYPITLKKKNGEDLIVKLNDRIYYDGETKSTYLEGSIRDITQQVLTEEKKKLTEKQLREEKNRADLLAEEAMRQSLAKSQFLAYLGHEVRTPINGIIGYLSLLENGYYDNQNEMKEFILNSKSSAESLVELLNSILDLSKIESGRMELYEVDFNLTELLDKAISVNLGRIREKGLDISKEIDSKIPAILHGDATRINQIFINLINNAIKFTEKGKIEIYCRVESITDDDIVIMSSIRDTGIGIPKEKLDSLFKPFSQTDISHTAKYGGSGLGLMICKEFVKMMGGRIDVHSDENVGSTFNFTIKLTHKKSFSSNGENVVTDSKSQISDSKTSLFDRDTDDVSSKRKTYNILIAEDNVVNQKILQKMISQLGYSSSIANNGKEAIESVKRNQIHAVLMDLQMPELDGLEATKIIRGLGDFEKQLPIIAITAHSFKSDKDKCLEAGMNDHLAKPIQVKELERVLDSWLNLNLDSNSELVADEVVTPIEGIFDHQRFKEMSLGDKNFQRELLMDYFEDLENRIIKLHNFYSTNDTELFKKEIHTIKGSSFTIGATRIAEEAVGIELSAKCSDWESVNNRLKTFKDSVNQTKEIVKHLL